MFDEGKSFDPYDAKYGGQEVSGNQRESSDKGTGLLNRFNVDGGREGGQENSIDKESLLVRGKNLVEKYLSNDKGPKYPLRKPDDLGFGADEEKKDPTLPK